MNLQKLLVKLTEKGGKKKKMKMLIPLVRYEWAIGIKYVWIYYVITRAVVCLSFLLASILVGAMEKSFINALELNSMV